MGHWYYDWKEYRLAKLTSIPKTPHFALMVVEEKTYVEAGYDRGDPNTTGNYDNVTYYAFRIDEKHLWEKLISDIYKEQHSKQNFYGSRHPDLIFFQSSGRGEVDIKIDVNVNIK